MTQTVKELLEEGEQTTDKPADVKTAELGVCKCEIRYPLNYDDAKKPVRYKNKHITFAEEQIDALIADDIIPAKFKLDLILVVETLRVQAKAAAEALALEEAAAKLQAEADALALAGEEEEA